MGIRLDSVIGDGKQNGDRRIPVTNFWFPERSRNIFFFPLQGHSLKVLFACSVVCQESSFYVNRTLVFGFWNVLRTFGMGGPFGGH